MISSIKPFTTRVIHHIPGCFFALLLGAIFWAQSANLQATYSLQHRTNNLAIYAEEPVSGRMKLGLNKLDERIDKLQSTISIFIDEPAIIYITKDHASYQRLSLGKQKIVEFSDAFYSGQEAAIYIRPAVEIRESFSNTLLHEYLHWYLEKIFSHAPLWFHEGMATHFSGQMGFERYLYFLQQSFLGRSSDLYRMSYNYPEKQEDWQIFYLSSSMAVRFMSENKAKEWKHFWDIVASIHRSGEKAVFADCFGIAYRSSLYDFHIQFAAYVKRLRYQYLFWGLNSLLALLLPLVLILGHRIKRRRMAMLPDLPEPEEADTEDINAIELAENNTDKTDSSQ